MEPATSLTATLLSASSTSQRRSRAKWWTGFRLAGKTGPKSPFRGWKWPKGCQICQGCISYSPRPTVVTTLSISFGTTDVSSVG